jgi:hypothetical protein
MLLAERRDTELDSWLAQAERSGLPESTCEIACHK